MHVKSGVYLQKTFKNLIEFSAKFNAKHLLNFYIAGFKI